MEPIAALTGICYTYEGDATPAVQDLDFAVFPRERVAVIGPGGSGKSTLCRILSGLAESPSAGGVLDGKMMLRGVAGTRYTAADAAGRIGYVSQDAESSTIMNIVEDELAFGPENMLIPPEEIHGRIDDALNAVGLLEVGMRQRRVSELSGGQQQRIAIAAVHAMLPELLVFDDAAANLDAEGARRFGETLRRLHEAGHALVIASPRWESAEGADRVVVLADGRIAASGAPEEVLAAHRALLHRLGCLAETKTEERVNRNESPSSPVLRTSEFIFSYSSSGGSPLIFPELELRPGEIVALWGPNGTGKTTFGKLLAGLLPSPAGAVTRNGPVGYVFQQPEHQFVADSVFEDCAFGLRIQRPRHLLSDEDKDAVDEQLRRFGLLPYRDRHPLSLSMSDRRLLNLASSLLLRPAIIVLDEPTAGMDYARADRFMRLVAHSASEGAAALLISHDAYAVKRWASRTITFRAR